MFFFSTHESHAEYGTARGHNEINPGGRELRLWGRLVNDSELLFRNLDWTFARLEDGKWRPLGQDDANLVLLPVAPDGSYSLRPRAQLERQDDLRLECAHRHQQVFRTDTLQGMRSHFRSQQHPKAMPAPTILEKAGKIVLATLHLIALAAIYVAIVATADFALHSFGELLTQRCGSPIPLAVAHCATHQTSLKIAIALIVLLIALAAVLVYRLVNLTLQLWISYAIF
ncbi:hypothetical protein OC844_006352 [Tilletia horrida]|nr:hypothetical protein OC844_006352 [Tilletia horrida]